MFPYIFFSSTANMTWICTSPKIRKQGSLALVSIAHNRRSFPCDSPLVLNYWQGGWSQVQKKRGKKVEMQELMAATLKIHICAWHFRYSWMIGSHLLLKVGWEWGGAVTRRACATLECIHSLLLSQRGPAEGFLLMWQLVKLLCSIRYGFSPRKKVLQFFVTNHLNSLFLSSLYRTGVGLMECASKEIFRSKSKKSYECIPCVIVPVKSWAQQSHLTLSHCLFELCGWHLFVIFWMCSWTTKGTVFFFSCLKGHWKMNSNTAEFHVLFYVKVQRIPWVYFQYVGLETEGNFLLHIKLMCKIDFQM